MLKKQKRKSLKLAYCISFVISPYWYLYIYITWYFFIRILFMVTVFLSSCCYCLSRGYLPYWYYFILFLFLHHTLCLPQTRGALLQDGWLLAKQKTTILY